MRLFVGGYSSYIAGEYLTLTGDLEFSAAHNARTIYGVSEVNCLLDSGAFNDAPEARHTPESALARQLTWEQRSAALSGMPEWCVSHLVSYDRLIDEVWVQGKRIKRRWTVRAADAAVAETVQAAAYLASQREVLTPRTLILSCQGVDAAQYAECAAEVLRHATSADWLGLGGWCILGRWRSWLPEFFRTCRLVLPLTKAAGVRHIHIFGVLWEPALGGLLWLADALGLSVSTDSSKPLSDCTKRDARKSGLRVPGWRGNVGWWKDTLEHLRDSPYYREPAAATQLGWEWA